MKHRYLELNFQCDIFQLFGLFFFRTKFFSDKILRLFEHNVRKWTRAKILKAIAIVLSKRGIGGGGAIKLFSG
jgi:hypothetical protein